MDRSLWVTSHHHFLSLSLSHTRTHGPATEPLVCEKDGPAHKFIFYRLVNFHTHDTLVNLFTNNVKRTELHIYSRPDAFIFVTWLMHMCDSCIRFTWHLHMCDMAHLFVWNDAFTCVTWVIHMCDVAYSYVWHDSFICVTWLLHVCDMTHRSPDHQIHVLVCVCGYVCVKQIRLIDAS